MKKYIAFFALLFMGVAAFAQDGINNVFIQRSINGEQVSMQVMLSGPGANDVQAIDLIFSNGMDCRICTTTILPMSASSGNFWVGGGISLGAISSTNQGIIRIEDGRGDFHDWTYHFLTGNGNGVSANRVWRKAENDAQ